MGKHSRFNERARVEIISSCDIAWVVEQVEQSDELPKCFIPEADSQPASIPHLCTSKYSTVSKQVDGCINFADSVSPGTILTYLECLKCLE